MCVACYRVLPLHWGPGQLELLHRETKHRQPSTQRGSWPPQTSQIVPKNTNFYFYWTTINRQRSTNPETSPTDGLIRSPKSQEPKTANRSDQDAKRNQTPSSDQKHRQTLRDSRKQRSRLASIVINPGWAGYQERHWQAERIGQGTDLAAAKADDSYAAARGVNSFIFLGTATWEIIFSHKWAYRRKLFEVLEGSLPWERAQFIR